MKQDSGGSRGSGLTILAVLMALLAVSNLMKPVAQMMAPEGPTGFVFFGHRLHGMANAVVAPLFGVLLATYAYGVWNLRRWVVPLAVAYAAYVVVNLVLFTVLNATKNETSQIAFNLMYAIVAVGVSSGAARYFVRNRDRLR